MLAKTRELSTAEYFINLQKEYLIADLRRKVYFKESDRKYWTKVAAYKRERIEKIALRSNISSIFSDHRLFEEIKFTFYGKGGFPNIPYKDEYEYSNLHSKDVYGYYAKDIDVRCEIDTVLLLAKVLFVILEKKIVVVLLNGNKFYLPYDKVTRVFL